MPYTTVASGSSGFSGFDFFSYGGMAMGMGGEGVALAGCVGTYLLASV